MSSRSAFETREAKTNDVPAADESCERNKMQDEEKQMFKTAKQNCFDKTSLQLDFASTYAMI